MPEVVSTVEQWRQRVRDEVEAMTLDSRWTDDRTASAFAESTMTTTVEGNAMQAGHLRFVANLVDQETAGYWADDHVHYRVELEVIWTYALRGDHEQQAADEEDARELASFVQQNLEPGPLAQGAGRRVERAPTFLRIDRTGGAWLVCTIVLEADVYVDKATAGAA